MTPTIPPSIRTENNKLSAPRKSVDMAPYFSINILVAESPCPNIGALLKMNKAADNCSRRITKELPPTPEVPPANSTNTLENNSNTASEVNGMVVEKSIKTAIAIRTLLATFCKHQKNVALTTTKRKGAREKANTIPRAIIGKQITLICFLAPRSVENKK